MKEKIEGVFVVEPDSHLVIVSITVLAQVFAKMVADGFSHVCVGIGELPNVEPPKNFVVCMTGATNEGPVRGAEVHGMQAKHLLATDMEVPTLRVVQ